MSRFLDKTTLGLIRHILPKRLYPISILVAILLFLELYFLKDLDHSQILIDLVGLFSTGCLFFFVFLCEAKFSKHIERLISILASVLLTSLVFWYWKSHITNHYLFGQIPIMLGALILFGRSLSEGDLGIWQWQNSLIKSLIESVLVGMAFIASILSIEFLIHFVFDFRIPKSLMLSIIKLGMTLVPAIAFLIRIPTPRDLFSKFSKGLLQYFLFPLWAFYLCLLNIYAFKILVQWSLPKGMVSYPICFAFGAYILLWWGSIPFRDSNKPKWISSNKTQHIVHAMHLPLLILMAMAIGKRIMDYGLSQPRYFLCLGWMLFCGVLLMASLKRLTGKNFVTLLFLLCLASLIRVG